jgi:hypothetical protein
LASKGAPRLGGKTFEKPERLISMSTRRATNPDERPQERYMSSREFVDRRGLLATAVAAKAQLCRHKADRSLLFFLQGLSMKAGGIAAVADDILNTFPGRICAGSLPEPSQEELGQAFAAYLAGEVAGDVKGRAGQAATAAGASRNVVSHFAQFLELLCIDPSLDVARIRENKFSPPAAYFRDPIGAIDEFRRSREAQLRREAVLTSLGKEAHRALDAALATGGFHVIEAKSGSGKTHAVEHWCEVHLGEARFVTLSGITHRTSFFQKLAASFGLAASQQASSKRQARVETFLASAKLVLVIDEAAYLWPQHQRSTSAPELVDWANTMVNAGVAVVLICTDQFQNLKKRAERTGWTSDQFIHRTQRYHQLDSIKLTKADVTAVVSNMLASRYDEQSDSWIYDEAKRPDQDAVRRISSEAFVSRLPLATARQIISAAQFVARHENGRSTVALGDIAAALTTQEASDLAIRNALIPGARSDVSKSPMPRPKHQMSNFSPGRRSRNSTGKRSDLSLIAT